MGYVLCYLSFQPGLFLCLCDVGNGELELPSWNVTHSTAKILPFFSISVQNFPFGVVGGVVSFSQNRVTGCISGSCSVASSVLTGLSAIRLLYWANRVGKNPFVIVVVDAQSLVRQSQVGYQFLPPASVPLWLFSDFCISVQCVVIFLPSSLSGRWLSLSVQGLIPYQPFAQVPQLGDVFAPCVECI